MASWWASSDNEEVFQNGEALIPPQIVRAVAGVDGLAGGVKSEKDLSKSSSFLANA